MAADPTYTEKTNRELEDLPEEVEAEKKANEMPEGEKHVDRSVMKVCLLIAAAAIVVLMCAAVFA
ncbi:hypothetical protein QJ043_00440 [Olsenella sp. YH-ols2217]|uniref:DUF3040 domain-containing protein n=1 Tax=Kribbibacterium absianum TaxID=3044210 RepID=A0ABT6ZHM4_9ACTN|nr:MULTISPECIES: hypothetical protein [unclassified Olsenella]MDJ1121065.1 hypothetical protein [Olsenella sp. YH-ols2216]MDJ1128556.1 hypothetical protein [Olsenella sp. YH-ols2217]